jgi:peptidyl-prolyl cis-trans isomerase A (cyclophilin A)
MLHFSTSKGDFTVELYHDDAPISAENFLEYARSGHFEGTVFHRVIPDFMIQGGGMTADMKSKKTRAPIKNEATNGLKNRRGTLSMARTNDVNSATSQFFVNLKDNAFLDNKPGSFGYAVFARIVDGMDVVDAIAAVETGSKGGHDDVPVEPIVINSVKVVDDK